MGSATPLNASGGVTRWGESLLGDSLLGKAARASRMEGVRRRAAETPPEDAVPEDEEVLRGGTPRGAVARGAAPGSVGRCQTSVEDLGCDLPLRRASAEAATGTRLGARGRWLIALRRRRARVRRWEDFNYLPIEQECEINSVK